VSGAFGRRVAGGAESVRRKWPRHFARSISNRSSGSSRR
jgi:hypothetical protein